MNVEKEIENLTTFIRNYVISAGKKGCVVGISGGIDSAVIAALCVNAVGASQVFGLSMPLAGYDIHANSTARAQKLADELGIQLESFPIKLNLSDVQYSPNQLAIGNYCARLRMATLYLHAEHNNCLVIGTDNKTENFLGYFTKYGDGGVDINPIGQYYKHEVYELGRALNVTNDILNCKPSAELYMNQTDEEEIGLTYDRIDKAIHQLETVKKIDEMTDIEACLKVRELNKKTQHKRTVPAEYERTKDENC